MHRRKSSTGSLVSFKSTPPIFTAQTRSSRGFQRLRSSFNRTLVGYPACSQENAVLIWDAAEHNDDENARWCWLRAVEWINWPIFLSSSIVPLSLLFWKWQSVAPILAVCNWLWHFFVGRRGRFVSIRLGNFG